MKEIPNTIIMTLTTKSNIHTAKPELVLYSSDICLGTHRDEAVTTLIWVWSAQAFPLFYSF
jgi:hypothetical protein